MTVHDFTQQGCSAVDSQRQYDAFMALLHARRRPTLGLEVITVMSP